MHTTTQDPNDDFSDDMFLTAARFLGVPICVTSDALVTRVTVTGNRTEELENALDASKITTIIDNEMRFRSLAEQAAWLSIRDDLSVTDAAARFALARETVSRARSKLLIELQNLFDPKF